MTDWMLDELAHAGDEHLDADFVAGYDRKQGHPDPTPDLDLLAARGVGPSSTVLDVAAGTGQFTLAAARRFGRVVALDVSPVMLAVLRDRVAAEGLTSVDCMHAGFLSYDHDGPPVDAIHTRNALHQLPDFWKALALHRLAGVLRPGGVLLVRDIVYDCAPSEVDEVFERWFAGAATDPARGYTTADFVTHIRTEHSTFRWLFEPMLAAAGFEIAGVEYTGQVYAAYTCVLR